MTGRLAPAQGAVSCTPMEARSCPIHGVCVCGRILDNPGCWLHGNSSTHPNGRTGRQGSEPAPRLTGPARFDAAGFRAELERVRSSRGLTWRAVADEVGVAAGSLTRLNGTRFPDVTTLVRILLWLGNTDLRPFITGTADVTKETRNGTDDPNQLPKG
jgi:hypothetical protein